MRLRVLNDLGELEDKEFLVLMDQYNIEIFSCFLRLLPLYSSTFHRSIFFSRLMTMDEEKYSVVLTLDKRWANNLLAQHQSTFFPRWVQFLQMSRQEYVFVVLL